MATRAELESAAVALDQLALSSAYGERIRGRARAQAAAIRGRLANGDFRAGDRIVIQVEGELAVDDTSTVLDGLRLPVRGFRQIELAGVLRSELEAKLRVELTDVVRNATVTARPLMRLGVFGSVGRPGYQSVPAETTVDGLLMSAGGPVADAATDKMVFVRADTVLVAPAGIRAAVADRLTIGALDLTDGDQLFIPQRGAPWDRGAVLQMVGFVMGPLVAILVVRQNR